MSIRLIFLFVLFFLSATGVSSQDFSRYAPRELLEFARVEIDNAVAAEVATENYRLLNSLELALVSARSETQRRLDFAQDDLEKIRTGNLSDELSRSLLDFCNESQLNRKTAQAFLDKITIFIDQNRGGFDVSTAELHRIYDKYTVKSNVGRTTGSLIDTASMACSTVEQDFSSMAQAVSADTKELIDRLESDVSEYSAELSSVIEFLPRVKAKKEEVSKLLSQDDTRVFLRDTVYWLVAVIGVFGVVSILAIQVFPARIAMEWVSSGQVIQFVTVTILLSVVMSLGLSGILQEDTLGTLLGGIGGYVLSQGVGRAAAHRAKQEANDAETPEDISKSYASLLKSVGALLTVSTKSEDVKTLANSLVAQAQEESGKGQFESAIETLSAARRIL